MSDAPGQASRRGLLTVAATAAGALVALAPGAIAATADGANRAATRAVLKTIDPVAVALVMLEEGLRHGPFRSRLMAAMSNAERALALADDAGQQGLFVKSTANPLYVWERIGALSIDHFGADPAAADNAPAIQAALDLFRPEWSIWSSDGPPVAEQGRSLIVPPRIYHLKAGLTVWSKIGLHGLERTQSTLVLDADANGSVLIQLGGSRIQPGIGSMHRLADLALQCARPGARAISAAAAIVREKGFIVNWLIERLNVNASYGIILDAYCQQTMTRDIYFAGKPERLVKIAGARNALHNLNKEAHTGTATSESYILIGSEDGAIPSGNNVVDNLLIEQLVHAAKPIVRIAHSREDHLFDVHLEPGGDAFDSMFSLTEASGIRLGKLELVTPKGRHIVKLAANSTVTIDRLSRVPATDWREFFSIDATSRVIIDELETYTGSQLDAGDGGRIEVRRVTRRTREVTRSPIVTTAAACNLIVNPDFSAGLFGWSTALLAGARVTLIPSRVVAHGQALRLSWDADASGSFALRQLISLPAAMMEQPFVLMLMAEIQPRGTADFSLSYLQAELGSNTIQDGRIQGPGLVTASTVVVPKSAASTQPAVIIANPRAGWTYDVHFVSLSPGRTVLPLANAFGSLRVLGTGNGGGFVITGGDGSPEGRVTAPPGSLYVRSDTGRHYIKEAGGDGPTGWIVK